MSVLCTYVEQGSLFFFLKRDYTLWRMLLVAILNISRGKVEEREDKKICP